MFLAILLLVLLGLLCWIKQKLYENMFNNTYEWSHKISKCKYLHQRCPRHESIEKLLILSHYLRIIPGSVILLQWGNSLCAICFLIFFYFSLNWQQDQKCAPLISKFSKYSIWSHGVFTWFCQTHQKSLRSAQTHQKFSHAFAQLFHSFRLQLDSISTYYILSWDFPVKTVLLKYAHSQFAFVLTVKFCQM